MDQRTTVGDVLRMRDLGMGLGLSSREYPVGGIAYLLRDQFTTPEAAPIASPRTCEPGPGTLALTQIDGAQWSIVDGNLTDDTSAVGWFKQVWATDDTYAVNASPGCIWGMKVPNGFDTYVYAGMCANKITGWAPDGISRGTADALNIIGTGSILTPYVASEPFEFYMIPRPDPFGHYFLLKQSGVTKLVYARDYANYGLYHWTCTGYSNIGDFSEVFITEDTWYPTPLQSDTFDRADSSDLGSTDGAGWENAASGTATAWIQSGLTDTEIVSNGVEQVEASDAYRHHAVECGEADIFISMKWTPAASGYGIFIARYTDSDNMWQLQVYNGNGIAYLYERTGGIWYQRNAVDVDADLTASPHGSWQLDGDDMLFGLTNGKGMTYSSSAHNTSTKHGFALYTTGDRVLKWACFAVDQSESIINV